jgi:hypothetical protein
VTGGGAGGGLGVNGIPVNPIDSREIDLRELVEEFSLIVCVEGGVELEEMGLRGLGEEGVDLVVGWGWGGGRRHGGWVC